MPSRSVSRGSTRGAYSTLALGLAALLLALPLGSAERPNEPAFFAIQNARIVTVSGPVIENGTVVLEKGLITAVGTEVAVPPEAWVIDAEGLTVYPGLIDALTNLGLQAEAPATPSGGAAAQAQRARQAPSRGPEDRPASTPWKNAADEIKTADKRLENWRKAGFTSAITSPDKGILPGQAALINLAGERPREMVLKTPVALRINLQSLPGFFNFPGSLMGVFSYVRQVFLDADHYDTAWTIYESNPRGLERPTYDRTLEPIRRAVNERWPVLIPGHWARQIKRALNLGDTLGANTLLYGAHQGYAVAGLLAEKNVPVLVSLKWPEKPKDPDPEDDEPLRELRFRDRAPSTPAEFHQAGVKFAFYSDGLATPKEIFKNAKKAVEAGLPTEAAVRALTLSAAEIFGVADRLGSIEEGKIANLVVTDGDILEEKTKVKMVFVDGRKHVIREPSRPKEPPTVNLTGKWTITVTTPRGPQESTADLEMEEDGTLSGTLTGQRGTVTITSGWVSGNKFSFTLSITMGPRTMEASYTGTVEGDTMSGTVSMGPFTTDFSGTRPEGGATTRARRVH